MTSNDPFYLIYEDKSPAKIKLIMNEEVLYNQFAVCEVWNGYL